MYYLGCLAQGRTKASVIAQIAKSPECRPLDEIDGLKKLTTDTRRATSWLGRKFSRRDKIECAVYAGATKLAQIDSQLAVTNQHLASLQETLKIATNEHMQQTENLVLQVAQSQIATPKLDQLQVKPQQLSSKTVEQAFIDILGRAPETVDVINQFANSESRQALHRALMSSTEFQSRLADLPECSRSIFMRQLRLQNALAEG